MKTNPHFAGKVITRPLLNISLRTFLFILIAGSLVLFTQCQTNKNYTEAGALPFHKWAPTPPMGWNSWDSYGPTVVEDEVKANADYMAKYLKKFGWQYIIIDIRWYVENDKSGGYNEVDPRYVMDEYGRYLPALNRFPSAANGKGFKPIADYIHGKGLKFGIHMMRGIPVIAVKQNTPVLGTNVKASDIYSPLGQCGWLRDNYTIDSQKEGAQAYYNSLFQLYASWGLDFVKVDDLSGRLPEIEMVRKAIDNCGRPIVLSISPGGNQTSQADFLFKNANMWRTTGDFWDNWPQMKPQFASCASWAAFTGDGHFADADMLPLGKIGLRAERGAPRMSGFTKDEQYSLMSLFAIFRSPLMFGGDLPSNDAFTLSLITNKDVLYVNQHSKNGKQVFRESDLIAWSADDPKQGDKFVALFNAQDQIPIDTTKAVYKSNLITQDTPEQAVDIDIDVTGARKLYLVVTYDEGVRASPNADWIEPTLTIGKKTINLTDLKWVKAPAGRGEPILNATARGGKLTIGGKEYKNGISANATSIIEYDLPVGVTRFKTKAGLDNGASAISYPGQDPNSQRVRQNNAKFLVFIEDPAGPVPTETAAINVKFDQLGLTGTHTVTDLWTGEKLGKFTNEFTGTINRHGAGLYRIH
ncbi:MAG TPA: NPCBM/NEW2 domain-containing protein [Bacteroidales bacterium]